MNRGVIRLDPITHDWIIDQSGWQFELFGLWIARFGESWRARYPTTWAVAFRRGQTYYYTPEEPQDGH